MDTIACNLCNTSVEFETVHQDDSIILVKCLKCGLVFDKDVSGVKEDSKEDSTGVHRGIDFYFGRKNDLVFKKEIRRISEFVPPKGKKFLDFGCGVGIFLEQAKNVGYETLGIEMNIDAVSYVSEKKLFPIYESVESLIADNGENFIDVVIMSHVFEHVSDPRKILCDINKLLKPGGLIVIISPALNKLTLLLDKFKHITKWGLIGKGHQYYYTRKTMYEYLKKADFFKIVHMPSITGGILMRITCSIKSVALKNYILSLLKFVFTVMHFFRMDVNVTCYAWKPENK